MSGITIICVSFQCYLIPDKAEDKRVYSAIGGLSLIKIQSQQRCFLRFKFDISMPVAFFRQMIDQDQPNSSTLVKMKKFGDLLMTVDLFL